MAADSITMHLAAVVAIWASPDIESMSARTRVRRLCVHAFQNVCIFVTLESSYFLKSAVKIVRRARHDDL